MAYADEVLLDSPLAYWKLDETSGTNANDSSPNNNDGTYISNFTLGQPGPMGDLAVEFPGAGGRINATVSTVDTTAGNDVTVEWWQYWDGEASTGDIFAFNTAETGNYAVWIDATVNPIIYGFNTFNNDIFGIKVGDGFTANLWHHIVAVFRNNSRGACRLFINTIEKTLSQQRNLEGPSNDCTTSIRIGAGAGPAHPWDGRVAHVAIYNGLLSLERITQHYRVGVGGFLNVKIR